MARRSFAGLLAAVALLGVMAPSAAVRASAPPGTSCPVFPADNVWNTDISNLPVNSHSAAWLASTGATSGRLLHPDFGGPPYGIPFNVVSSSHATANFNFLYIQNRQAPKAIVPLGTLLAGWQSGKPATQRALLLNLFDELLVKDGRIEGWTPRHDVAGEVTKFLDSAFADGAASMNSSGAGGVSAVAGLRSRARRRR